MIKSWVEVVLGSDTGRVMCDSVSCGNDLIVGGMLIS